MFDNNKASDISIMKPAPRKENCELVSMKKNEDGSVSFTFLDESKAELTHREFKPSRVINGKTLTDEEFKKNISLIQSRIAHITRAFVPEEIFKKIVTTSQDVEVAWPEYLKLTAQALKVTPDGRVGAAVGIKCALKVVYRAVKGKYYASLPNVPAFISTPSHPKEFTTNPQYDIYEIPRVTPDAPTALASSAFDAPVVTTGSPVANDAAPNLSSDSGHASGW